MLFSHGGAPVPGGRPNAEPGGGRASSAAQRHRLKRSVRWSATASAVGLPGLRVHDLRHTAASVWLAAGADPKVIQRVLGHATTAMTMDLYGHMMDASSGTLPGLSGTSEPLEVAIEDEDDQAPG